MKPAVVDFEVEVLEAQPGFEPGMEVLQACQLDLPDATKHDGTALRLNSAELRDSSRTAVVTQDYTSLPDR